VAASKPLFDGKPDLTPNGQGQTHGISLIRSLTGYFATEMHLVAELLTATVVAAFSRLRFEVFLF